MPFDNKGNYTPASGATNAAPGQVIRSATWDAINVDYTTALTTLGNVQFSQNARTVSTPGAVTILSTDALVEITVSVSVINLPASSLMLWPVRIAGNAAGIFSTKNSVVTPNGTDKISGLSTVTLTTDYQFIELTPLSTGGWLSRSAVGSFPNGTLLGNISGSSSVGTALTASQTQSLIQIAYITYELGGVNFNSANTDNSFTIALPTGFNRYRINRLDISGATASISTATCGLFTGAGATGTPIVTSGTAITVTTASENTNNNSMTFTINNANTQSYNVGTLFFRVQNPQGSAATATVTLVIQPVS